MSAIEGFHCTYIFQRVSRASVGLEYGLGRHLSEVCTMSVTMTTDCPAGIRQGHLFKRKKQCDEWNSRWFVLSNDSLTYYKSHQVSSVLARNNRKERCLLRDQSLAVV